jgi:antitoxin MazE
MSQAVVGKWRNNLAIRVPFEIARASGPSDGERVEIETLDGDILIRRPAARARRRGQAEAPQTRSLARANAIRWAKSQCATSSRKAAEGEHRRRRFHDHRLALRRRAHRCCACRHAARRHGWRVVPSLWRLEVANVLRNAVRRGRCDDAYVDRSLERQPVPGRRRQRDQHACLDRHTRLVPRAGPDILRGSRRRRARASRAMRRSPFRTWRSRQLAKRVSKSVFDSLKQSAPNGDPGSDAVQTR